MRKLRYILSLSLTAILLTLSACSKESGLGGDQPNKRKLIESKAIAVNLSVGVDEDDSGVIVLEESEANRSTREARLTHAVNATTGRPSTLLMKEKDLNIRIAVRYTDAAGVASIVTQTLKFVKVAGQKKATYTGNINVPSTASATGGGTLELAGVLLSEEGGRTFATVNPTTDEVEIAAPTQMIVASAGSLDNTLPYVADWTPATWSSVEPTNIAPLTMSFKPSGTILRLRIRNIRSINYTFNSIKIRTNAFVDKWSYDFDNFKSGGNLREGQATSTASWEKTYPLPAPITLSQNQYSNYYYLCIMPVKATTGLKTELFAVTNIGQSFYPFRSFKEIGNQSAFATIATRVLPLSYVAKYNVGPTDGTFATTHNNGAIGNYTQGYYDYDHAIAYGQSPQTLGGSFQPMRNKIPGYYLASAPQWAAIFPAEAEYLFNSPAVIGAAESVIFPGEASPISVTSDYIGDGTTLYGLRFKNGTDKSMLVAYRYRLVGNFALNSNNSRLEITSRYLGNSFTGSITTINNNAFWATNNEEDVVRYFPAAGYIDTDGTNPHFGRWASYWTDTQYDATRQYGLFFGDLGAGLRLLGAYYNKAYSTRTGKWNQLRLFYVQPLD